MIASASGLASGLLNAAVLALSARTGQTGEIATYAVVTAALTLVAVAVAVGSPLLYLSGDAGQRRAVRSQRVFLTLPTMLAVGAAAATLAAEVLGLAVLRRRGRLSAWIINPPPVGRARR
ncbi:hypothetical protein V6U89_15635 [Micromonospora sp. CPCC 206171]|uniref:hypothetical protein n=1 Tax=Micromonospora sp. CPCC 206171 TaxID=3122405 RepID=UPI002FF35BF1